MRTRTQRAEKRTTTSPSFLGKFERLKFNADLDARAVVVCRLIAKVAAL